MALRLGAVKRSNASTSRAWAQRPTPVLTAEQERISPSLTPQQRLSAIAADAYFIREQVISAAGRAKTTSARELLTFVLGLEKSDLRADAESYLKL